MSTRKCSQCKVRITAGEHAVPDGKGGWICEDCQKDERKK